MLFGKNDECRGARKSMRSLLIGFLIGGAVTSIVGSKLLASQENEDEKDGKTPETPKEPQES